MLHSRRARARAFTLVELLVVIGIIALLIGILLPVMGRVRSQGRTVSCQANLRSILQSLFIYAADNKGSLPYSFVWNQMVLAPGPARNGQSTDPSGAYSFNWASMCSKIMKPTANSAGMLSFAGFAPVFKCPEAQTRSEFIQPVHYSVQSVAMPTMRYELAGYPFSSDKELTNRWPIRPARIGQDLYNDNALIWDSPLNLSFLNWEPGADKQLGPEWTEIDGGQLTYPSAPSYRYRDTTDWYGTPDLSWGYPIFYPSPVTAPQLTPNTDLTTNAFPPNLTITNYHTGTPRWRHNQNTMCNVGFADGSVKPIQWYPKRFVKGTSPAQAYAANDFLRRYIMIKWPKDRVPEF